MPAFFNFSTLFILLSYLLLSAVPFFPFLLGKQVDKPWQILGIEFFAWLSVWAIFKRPARFHWLLIPAFLGFPTCIYLYLFYGQGITAHHLGIIAETNPTETIEFLGKKIWLLLAVTLAVIGWWWVTWRMARKTVQLDWNDKISRMVTIVILAAGLCTWTYGYTFGLEELPTATEQAGSTADSVASSADEAVDEEEEENNEEPPSAPSVPAESSAFNLPKLPTWAQIPVEKGSFAESWPFGIALSAFDFWNERQYLADLASKNSQFAFGAFQVVPNDVPQVVVLVIGESGRFDRWELNGYHRKTNPLLRQETNLVSLQDLITPVSATRQSVPVIITRKPGKQSLKSGFSEKSVLTAFKEAGFKTYWLSNQISFGQFDTPISAFAKEADVIQFLNLGGYTDRSNFDQILLEPMQNAIKDPAPKKLIVLHTLGNHWNYSHRHPQEFDKWQPSLFGINKPEYTDLKIKQQMNNSYDNSVLYVDWFLSQVISQLKSSGLLSSMLYVSDHGQVLYDGSCTLAFHGHNTQYDFHIPAVVWYSDKYKAAYPEKIAQLYRHRKSKLTTENISHSLLDLANIQYPGERLEWSFVNSKFRRHRRYVDSYGWSNYDNAVFKGDCREVIDKGKPLSQDG
ncbi:MAG: phosphoethanolamine transferase [Burkholderiaceae bacterium]|nr:phosphoethanolamine transferase [Burkholderiaceae bacterium]